MVLQVQYSGTLTTDGTEQTLNTSVFVGVHVVQVDLSAMQAGDTVVLRAKTKTLTGRCCSYSLLNKHFQVYKLSQLLRLNQ